MQPDSSTDPIVAAGESAPPEKTPGPGRPRALDDAKRREICALVAGGCGLREAARYVRCGINTIRREAERNPEFSDQIRRSESYAQLSPLRAMQHAVGTHWRAAAWMLERAFPERFARPEPGAFGARQARELMNEVLHVISSETFDPFKYGRIEKRVRGTFEYYIRAACDRNRSTRSLRLAMKFFDDKAAADPLANFSMESPNFDILMNASHNQSSASPPTAQPPRPVPPSPNSVRPATMSDVLKAMRAELKKLRAAKCTAAPKSVPANPNNQPVLEPTK
jgi:hypothetical protein